MKRKAIRLFKGLHAILTKSMMPDDSKSFRVLKVKGDCNEVAGAMDIKMANSIQSWSKLKHIRTIYASSVSVVCE